MEHLEFTELLVVDKYVEVRVDAFRVGAHESEELGNHIFPLPFDRYLLRENKL